MAGIAIFMALFMAVCGLMICWQAWRIAYKERLDLLNGYQPVRLTGKDRTNFARQTDRLVAIEQVQALLIGNSPGLPADHKATDGHK